MGAGLLTHSYRGRDRQSGAPALLSSSPHNASSGLREKVAGKDDIIATYGACKPYLHGNDATLSTTWVSLRVTATPG